jgi:hypothetical protein
MHEAKIGVHDADGVIDGLDGGRVLQLGSPIACSARCEFGNIADHHHHASELIVNKDSDILAENQQVSPAISSDNDIP